MNYQNLTKNYQEIIESPIKRSYLSLGLTIGLILLLLVLLVPALTGTWALYNQVAEQTKTDQQLKAKLAALRQGESNYLSLQDSVTMINQALPNGPDVGNYIHNIEALASKSAIRIQAVQVSDVPLSKPATSSKTPLSVQPVLFNISLSGDYPNLKQFLKNIENLLRVTSVENVTFSNKSEANQPGALTINIAAKTFYMGSTAKKTTTAQ